MKETAAVIEEILAGNSKAFEKLINDHQRLVNHIVYRMVPDADDREDICQDIFMKVYQNLSAFRHGSKLSTWIARIAYNRCLDYVGKRKIAVSLDPLDGPAQNISDPASLPDRNLESAAAADLLQQEIKMLPVHFRTIITLYHLEEMSYADIGEVMTLPEGTVKSYLFRARRLLKERLLHKYTQEELLH
jgi:RNA polymerase sigma factor (sigma-70 family)